MDGVDLLCEKSTVGWLVVGADLVWKKNTAASCYQNRVYYRHRSKVILYVLELDLLLRDLNCLPLCCGMWTSETNGYFVRCRTWVGLGDIGCRKQKNPFF